MNSITRKDKHCNSYEEAIFSDTFRYIFNKIVRSHWGKNKVLLKNIFHKFLNQETITEEEKDIFTAFINDREVKIDAENIRKNITFSRMNPTEEKEIMDDFTAEHLIETLQNKIAGEIFTTLDKKAVEVLQTYWKIQILALYKNKKPYYAINKIWENIDSCEFILTGDEIPKIIPIIENWNCIWYGFSDGNNTFFERIFTYADILHEHNWKTYYFWTFTDSNWKVISSGEVLFWDELNEDGSIKYLS